MDRELKEVKLPGSGFTAKIVAFFTRGEAKDIELHQWEGGVLKYVDGQPVMENLPIDFTQRQEDKMLLVGTRELKNKAGIVVEVTSANLDILPNADTNVLLLALKKVYSGIETESKKK